MTKLENIASYLKVRSVFKKFSYLAFILFFSSCKDLGSDTIDLSTLENKKNIVPVVVIGSGPSGYAAALYTARGGNETLVIEGDYPGGQLMQTSYIENWPGIPKMSGPEVMQNFKKQCAEWKVSFLSDKVDSVDFSKWPFKIFTSNKKEINALSVVIATGASSRRLKIPGESEYWGTGGVSSCAVCDAPMFKDKDVVVVGGGDSAIEQVFQLSPYVKSIKMLVRKDEMRASKAMQEKLKAYDKVTVLFNSHPIKINGDGQVLDSVEILNNQNKTTTIEKISGFFLAIGHDPATAIFKDQIEMSPEGYIKTFGNGVSTSTRGVFVAGEAEDHIFMQAGTAAGDGIEAGMSANNFLRDIGLTPERAQRLKSNFFDVSLSPGELKELESITDFSNLVEKQSGRVVVDFYTSTCAKCPAVASKLKQIASKLPNIKFYKIDGEEFEEILDKYKILRYPTILIFDNGEMILRYAGETPTKNQLYEMVKDLKLPS